MLRPRLKIVDSVNLEEEFKNFTDTGGTLELSSVFDEFISINKTTRIISQYGYNSFLQQLDARGLIELEFQGGV